MATSMRTTRDISALFSLELVGDDQVQLLGAAISTSHLAPGFLFIAVQGAHSHGIDHLDLAIQNGAVAVLTDRKVEVAIPVLYHPNPRDIAGLISSEIFETSDSMMSMYAVTGTNGKTSTVYFLAELLNALGQSTGLISSALSRVGGNELPAELTTPEAPRIHQLLRLMREKQQLSAAVEASAQGLSRQRLQGLSFKVAGFTNLSRDHLDDYPDMNSYLDAKAALFDSKSSSRAVVMVEDEYASALFDRITIPKVAIGSDYTYTYQNGLLQIRGEADIEVNLEISNLMAKNLVLAVVMLIEDGYPADKVARAISSINLQVPGRLQRVSERTPAVFVDYAHTPAAVGASAKELRNEFQSLTVLLAASGDRDKGKRSEMALEAAKYATKIIVTDQHPRSEDPAEIRAQLISAISDFDPMEEVSDPAQAIARAIEITDAGGAVLWCGPGHLKYREVSGKKTPFDAVAVARKALGHD